MTRLLAFLRRHVELSAIVPVLLALKPITERGAIDPITGNGGEGRKTAGLGGAGGAGVIKLEWEE